MFYCVIIVDLRFQSFVLYANVSYACVCAVYCALLRIFLCSVLSIVGHLAVDWTR